MTWARSGTAPEVSRVTFESSPDGVTYALLGSGTRVAGGWQLISLSLPINQNVFIRARGYYGSGIYNGSGSIVESIRTVTLTNSAHGDFDGDSKAEIGVFRPSTGTWYIRYTATPTAFDVIWGGGSDIPVLQQP